jgi:hypothetical protein
MTGSSYRLAGAYEQHADREKSDGGGDKDDIEQGSSLANSPSNVSAGTVRPGAIDDPCGFAASGIRPA